MPELLLYSRHACHLCEVMQAELNRLLQDQDVTLDIRDVDQQAHWRERYGSRVPLLMTSQAVVLSEYHLDEKALAEWLAGTN